MRYTRHPSESRLGEGTQWTEFGDDGWATRQVESYAGRWFSSAVDPDPELGGTLCDQPLSSLDLTTSIDITAEELYLRTAARCCAVRQGRTLQFEEAWRRAQAARPGTVA